MVSDLQIASSWCCRILYPMAFAIVFRVFIKQYCRIKHENKMNPVRNSKYQKWLDLWSLLTLFLLAIINISYMMHRVPIICEYHIYQISSTIYGLVSITFIFYQIARLQYIFSAEQIHSTKYAYPI